MKVRQLDGIIIPDPTNPQNYNRYSYVNNRPLVLVDPSGHDPLDSAWQSAFEAAHNRPPEWYDRLIRLFSLAFPEEWAWDAFYNPDGTLISFDVLRDILTTPPNSRSWDSLPDALARLATYYESDERELFVRDVGTLFGGLPDRFQTSFHQAITGCSGEFTYFCEDPLALPSHVWAYVQPGSMPYDLTGSADADANVHHWAWGFALGFNQGYLAIGMNILREIDQAGGVIAAYSNADSYADILLGNRAALMGLDVWTFGASPETIQFLWQLNVMQRIQ